MSEFTTDMCPTPYMLRIRANIIDKHAYGNIGVENKKHRTYVHFENHYAHVNINSWDCDKLLATTIVNFIEQ